MEGIFLTDFIELLKCRDGSRDSDNVDIEYVGIRGYYKTVALNTNLEKCLDKTINLEKFSDIVLCAGEEKKKFYGHKVILSSRR